MESAIGWTVAIILWAFMSFVIAILPEMVGFTGYPLEVKIVTVLILAPISYFIVDWQENR